MNMWSVRVRQPPVRFHTDCKNCSGTRCLRNKCKIQPQEIACKNIELRFTDNYERFKCAHCGLQGPDLKATWIRTEHIGDTPIDVYKCETCGEHSVLYQTDKAQRCRKLTDIVNGL